MKRYYTKFISRAHDIINDSEKPHYPDLILHSKGLITMMTQLALKNSGVSYDFRNGRNISYDEKLEYLLDHEKISEDVYDNCINTLSLRNPLEHSYTYPNEFFAKGAAKSALDMYYSLQFPLDLPHIPKLDALASSLNVEPHFVLSIMLSRVFVAGEFETLEQISQSHPGLYQVLLQFPQNTVFTDKNGAQRPMNGIKLNSKVGYSTDLQNKLKTFSFVQSAEWAGLEIFPDHPNMKDFYQEQYPAMFKEKS